MPVRSPLQPCVLAIDPGRAKCGLAVVQRDGTALFQAVVPTESLLAQTQELSLTYRPRAIVIGNGTGSKPLLLELQAAGLPAPLVPVDEAYTSQAARVRYLDLNPPRGWQRLLPKSLRTPPVAYDDYVALILAERYWQAQAAGDVSSSPHA